MESTQVAVSTVLAQSQQDLDTFASFCDTQSEDYNVMLAVGMLPSYFGTSSLATYFGYRALGLSSKQALLMMHEDEDLLDNWRATNPTFDKFEQESLPLLQRYCAKELVRLGFMRNMTLLMAQDERVIENMMLVGIDNLTRNEFRYLQTIRKHYTNNDLLAIEKVINPEAHAPKLTEVNISWGNESMLEGNYDVLTDGS